MGMCAGGYVKRACRGIELSQLRYEAAKDLKTKVVLAAGAGNLGRRLKNQVYFVQGDLRDKDFSDATVIWTDNLVFPEWVNRAMGEKIASYPKVQTVAAISPVPRLED